ncbi:MAG: zinc ribbon domain-containing protein [Synergistaceae bacterium]|nr:zinc ribbon domain-containing protein [Synergistaceae bacterium]
MEQNYCQSCGMPMAAGDDMYGTNSDGGKNSDYCKYCYDNGAFTTNSTMEEMIDICVPHMLSAHPDMSEGDARKMMLGFFPTLKRWKK